MDFFSLLVFGSLAAVVIVLLALGRFSRRRTRDITMDAEDEAMAARIAIENRDVGEMVEGQNRYRRRRGQPPLTEADVRRRVGSEQLGRLDRADAEAKALDR